MWKIACMGLLLLGMWFVSCRNEDFNVGKYLVDSHTRMGLIDTVTIKVSNLAAADSVATSGTGNGFSGVYHDPEIGAVQAQTYIEFSRTQDSETNRYALFDSVTLVLRPNGNYYGDTVKYASFKISRLTKPIEKLDNGSLYSSSKTAPLGVTLADTSLKVRIKASRAVEMKLPRAFGLELFRGMLDNDDAFNADRFLKTFSGFSVSAGTGSACVHGLNIQDTACMIRIYYHISTTTREDKTMTFKANPANSFYRLDNDKAKLPPYNAKSDPVPSSQTGNKGIIMSGGSPMYARLEFPYLNNLLWLGQIVKIQKATLYVRPVRHSFDTVPLPPELNIYYFDPTSNMPLSEAIRPPSVSGSSSSSAQNGGLPANYQYIQSPDFPQYSFDVTDFFISQLGKVGYDKWALCLIIPAASRESTLQRLVFGNQQYWYRSENQSKENQVRLELIYVVYND